MIILNLFKQGRTLLYKTLFLSSALFISVNAFADELKVGDMAPHFKLQATDGHHYDLNDYKGLKNVILAFYPMANTRGCTFECRSLVQKGHMIKKFNAVYMMASVDSLEDNTEFAKKEKADFPMLSDPTKQTVKNYKVLNFLGLASRVTFYIGKDGRILHIDDDVNAETAAEDIARNLELLKIEPAEGF
ncbi:peroxiredoxin [Parashewanella spongiae]|uniref:thioredoxin-dependent peroxiredoxin n=1 Tax=Parashewanella spongiae TaxID=342950 RepID=A0A3A6U0W3_9GAMM|nr:redoxin domain-containing protein [Parashewanella spongiae]MCL1079044.1 peroxiredoxin family protein [Parashewanella spongiae]RJY10803.1 peroxiredoxin [Parashewanella spongiae]